MAMAAAVFCSLPAAPPSSKEEAIEQARACVWSMLHKPLQRRLDPPASILFRSAKMKKKKKKQQQQQQTQQEESSTIGLCVELPMREEETMAALLTALLAEVPAQAKAMVATCTEEQHAMLTPLLPPQMLLRLDENGDGGRVLDPSTARLLLLLVVAPGPRELRLLEAMSKKNSELLLLLLNPDWGSSSSMSEEGEGWRASFQVAYSLTPLRIEHGWLGSLFLQQQQQQQLGGMGDAVLLHCEGGGPWQIFAPTSASSSSSAAASSASVGELRCVASMRKRPTSKQLEDALYPIVAANSPLNKLISSIFRPS